MREGASMRDRVETGQGMLYAFGLPGVATWWWHGHTSAPSLWWVISLVGMIVGAVGVLRGTQLILSGFSGFGRNFHEERDPAEESPGDAAENEGDSRDSEAARVVALPLVLVISGGVVILFKVFPAMNFVPEFEGDHWVSPRFLVPWMFVAGVVLVGWSVLLLVMMKTGPDRWGYVPGTRGEIRRWTRIYTVAGIVLIGIGAVYAFGG
jgi:hypothetical protein